MPFRFRRTKSDDIDARIAALRSELNALQSDMKGLAGDVGAAADERLTSAIRDVESVASQAIQLAQDAAADTIEDVGHWGGSALNTARGTIRKQPFYALALAMGVGAAIGTACSRR